MKDSLLSYWKKNKIITDEKILEAFKQIKREDFVHEEFKKQAYSDIPLPIADGSTISQPTTVMIMLQELELKKEDKVLEVGTGSGWNSAILSLLARKIITIEYSKEAYDFAKARLKKFDNIIMIHGDGKLGYEKEQPYDKIIVTAASKEIPEKLLNQLKIYGIMLIPLGEYSQIMTKIIKTKDGIKKENLGNYLFVPLR